MVFLSTARLRWSDWRRSDIDQSTITRLGVGAALALAVAGALWFRAPASAPAAPPPAGVAPIAVRAELTVHVSGAVARPGLVALSAGARVADAIAAAGGTLRTAELANLNLAAPVRDGEQITVAVAAATGGAPVEAGDGKVRINSASAAALEALPGVGPVLAARIAAHREQHGPFAVVEDLLDVPGIGEAKLAGMRDVVAVP